jgi:glycosyltransferase involved in cell wall biosynthesis
MKRILFVVNAPEYFISHRLAIAQEAQAQGYRVHVASAAGNGVESGGTDAIQLIEDNGFSYHKVALNRGGQNPLIEMQAIFRLFLLMRRIKPDLVHLITIKPVLYGGIAARLAGVTSMVAAVAGLGTVFLAQSPIARLRRWLVTRLYRSVFRHKNLVVIFQNPDDQSALVDLNLIVRKRTRIIRGSGVQVIDYPYHPEPVGVPVVAMAARLLKDKGVYEFVDAARLLRDRGVEIEMRLIGSPDRGNPSSVSEQDVARWAAEGFVQLVGFRNDIAEQYAQANIVCLPSYREGLPKSLVEAAACGRSVVTTDVPGCRDAITPGDTGMLVPVKNSVALADAIQELVENAERRNQMGSAGRRLAEEVFAIEKVVEQHMSIYRELLHNA